jgi:precorrin-2/cobalt-factor-2 C20-methyltransferase
MTAEHATSCESTRPRVAGPADIGAVDRVLESRGRKARLVGVGVGPGDPELLTIKAARLIREASIVFAPVRRPGDRSLALEIVAEHVDARRQQLICVPFPERRDGETWEPAARRMVEALGSTRNGVFLTEGDPLLFGSFGHVAAAIRRLCPDLEIEIVPGVSSVTAAAAAAGIALADYEDRLAVVPATADLGDVERTLLEFECVVILKVGRRLGALLEKIERLGLSAGAVYVRRCGWRDQEIVRDVRSLVPDPPRDYFALLIVRRR